MCNSTLQLNQFTSSNQTSDMQTLILHLTSDKHYLGETSETAWSTVPLQPGKQLKVAAKHFLSFKSHYIQGLEDKFQEKH